MCIPSHDFCGWLPLPGHLKCAGSASGSGAPTAEPWSAAQSPLLSEEAVPRPQPPRVGF